MTWLNAVAADSVPVGVVAFSCDNFVEKHAVTMAPILHWAIGNLLA